MKNYYNSQSMPNQGFDMAPRKQEINPEALLLEGLTEIGGVLTTDDAIREGMTRLGELSESELSILVRLNNDKLKADFFTKKFALKPSCPIPDESETNELKAGLKAIPNTYWDTLRHGGLKLIISELAAFYNTTGNGSIYIGISDSTKRPTALEAQLACMYPNMTRDKFVSTVIFNLARTWTRNDSFLSSLQFSWLKLQNHLILKIDVKKKMSRDVVLCNPKDWVLPCRASTSLLLIKGYEMLKIYDQILTTTNENEN